MNIQTIEKPVVEKETPQEEEPPSHKPESTLLGIAMQKLIDGWVKMMGQGVAV